MKYLSLDEMKALNTRRLLAYKKKYLQNSIAPICHLEGCVYLGGQCQSCNNVTEVEAFELAYKNCKQELSNRENVK